LAQQGKEQEARQQELEKRFEAEHRAKLKDLDSRLVETLRDNEKRWESLIEQLRAQLEAAKAPKPSKGLERKMASLKREVREEWNTQVLEAIGGAAPAPAEPSPDTPLAVGDQVQVANISSPGTVMAMPDDEQVDIAVGHLHMRLPRSEVRRVAPAGTSATRPAVATRRGEEAPVELNVIGDTAELARARVDKFLDEAYMSARFRLRVIHGHGKGILRKSLHEMFASHPHVEKFYLAPPHEGGAGATIVELKT
jgi:DNA mismatch repair protein MutS2